MPDPITEFDLYRQELPIALGDDDLVAVLRAGLEEIPRLAAGAFDELRRAPAPGEWSAWQVLSHLADSDLMAGTRVRMIVTPRPCLAQSAITSCDCSSGGLTTWSTGWDLRAAARWPGSWSAMGTFW